MIGKIKINGLIEIKANTLQIVRITGTENRPQIMIDKITDRYVMYQKSKERQSQ